jgi:hypothetical protein
MCFSCCKLLLNKIFKLLIPCQKITIDIEDDIKPVNKDDIKPVNKDDIKPVNKDDEDFVILERVRF